MLTRRTEVHIRPALFHQRQVDTGRGQVGQVTAAIQGEVFHGLVGKLFEFLLVATFDPTSGVHGDRLVGALDLVFLLQTAGDDVELQHTDSAEDDVVAAGREEHLGGAFLGQLLEALAQLLGFERVFQAHAAEQLRGEVRDAGETQGFALSEGVADLDGAVVVQADDVTGKGFFQLLAFRGEERQGVTDAYVLAGAHVAHLHAFFVFARADAHEGDAVAVLGVHVRLDLEHEAGELLFHRFHGALVGDAGQRARCPIDHGVEHMVDTEVAQRRTEEHRGQLAVEEFLLVELMAGALHQLQLLDKTVVLVAQVGAGLVGVELLDDFGFGAFMTMPGGVDDDVIVGQVVHALEVAIAADRPGNRRGLDLQDRFDLVEQFDRVADVTVEFVDEADDRRVPQTADVHQGDGPWLDAFTAVEDHQRRVHRREGAVGVFGEVFVARGVEQVDHVIAIRELHDRRGNGNTPLFFHFHPVGGGMAVGLARFHRAGHRNRLAHQQELFGDGGLTGIGVGNNGKRASGVDFIDNFTIGHRLKSRLCTLICTQLKKYLWPIAKANTENRAL